MSDFVYQDSRSEFWKRHFEIAKDLDTYLNEGDPTHVSRWLESIKKTPDLSDEAKKRVQGYNRILNVLVYSGIWCGDCVRQVPTIKKISDIAGDLVNVKIIEREESPELMEELRLVGAHRVPVAVFLSEDFWEMARYGERTLSVYRAKAAREIGREFDAGILSPKAREKELAEWVDIFERVLIMLRLSPPLRRKYQD
jgi:thiol-disulfide isomerase/thioredoxin